MENVVSVIIPVYNVGLYLRQCLDSVVNQTYENLEIILIDDGSTDDSGKICDEYAQRDNRIKVIHQKNAGAAAAKNAGLRIANGEFLAFVDSDDYINENTYEYALSVLKEKDADVVQFCFENVYKNTKNEVMMLKDESEFDTVGYLTRFTLDWTCAILWNKVYRRELYKDIYFEEGNKIDDEFFTYLGIMNAKKIVYAPQVLYSYRARGSSVMLSDSSKKRIVIDRLNYLRKRRIDVTKRFPELSQAFNYHFLNMMVILSQDESATEESMQLCKNYLLEYKESRSKCKAELALKRKVFKIRHTSVDKLLSQIKPKQVTKADNIYFD